ncbi:lysophospholipid acyltransferase family protein [Alkalilimnicola ehrlichii MLHE-1]|nr:lysophospholipid acyltransferase family protein [Alkalilimnicola ehrlichii]
MNRSTLLHLLLTALSLLPLAVMHRLGAALGPWLTRPGSRSGDVLRRNLAICFPDLPEAERATLTHAAQREFGRQVLEVPALFRRPVAELLSRVERVEGAEVLDAAYRRGRGVIIAAPHLGSWELLNLWVARHYPLHFLYRPPRQPALEPIMVAARNRGGGRALPANTAGLRALYKALRAGDVVGILPDQEPPEEEGRFAPFFGRPALTMDLPVKLAARQRAPVVFGYARRLARGGRWVIRFRPAPAAIHASDAAEALAALNEGVEACVREVPEQYLWAYKRFAHAPPGWARAYPRRRR